jgi:hypothetical protein
MNSAGDGLPTPVGVHFLNALVFGAVAALLIFGRGGDRRAHHLGAVFMLFGSLFANRPLLALASGGGALSSLSSLLAGLTVDAFLPYFLWLFLADFPRETGFGFRRPLPGTFIVVSLTSGVLFFTWNLLARFVGEPSRLVRAFEPDGDLYWPVMILLTLPGWAYSLTRVRGAPPDERRRVGLFIGGIVLGFAPMALEVMLEYLLPPFRRVMSTPEGHRLGALVLYPLLLLAPLTTAYSVLVHRALGIRLAFRKALQYALVRYAFFAAVAAPAVVLVALAFRHRNERLADIATGGSAVGVAGVALAALLVFVLRHRVFNAIDRWFFREEYDARRVLTALIEKSGEAGRLEELTSLLVREIEGALHPQVVAVFTLDTDTAHLVSWKEGFRPLPATSFLATLLNGDPRPLSVDLELPGDTLRGLPDDERLWIADGGFRLLVPLAASGGALLALLALGEKKSELPYSREDRSLLMAIATAGALNLEKRLLRLSPDLAATPTMRGLEKVLDSGSASLAGTVALECTRCRAVRPAVDKRCSCGGPLETAPIPFVLAGKFQFDKRIGEGGMGVVYRAVDLALGREVAVKTLPRMSATYALRLRREARAIASLVHPNLATIFGAETWKGTPMLVFEYLGGGTLADRLTRSPLSPEAAVDLGILLAEALERIHSAGVLHCDVKPSNIGFTKDGVPKLLDFGLARILLDSQEQGALSPDALEALTEKSQLTPLAIAGTPVRSTHHVIGTPLYLSPEALMREPLDVGADLWAAAMVVYEAVAGRHPLEEQTMREALLRIARAEIDDVLQFRPDCPEPLAEFLRGALAAEKRRRPASARELKTRLQKVRSALSS